MKINWQWRPQWPYLGKLNELADRVERVHQVVTHVYGKILASDRPPPEPTALLFALGIGERVDNDGRATPVLVGDMRRGKPDRAYLELTVHQTLHNVRLFVATDLERTRVQIFYGTDLLTASLGFVPMALIERWDVGVRVHVVGCPVE